ncbi:uncharacterized protein [Nothobranchius furzeri]|uniref:uncharacterized protein isoform X4 n=1 Tax=Nothobranchius furzeri TaxID=105023 RepID=UPI0024040EC4|nr:uncharacterized protein LOC129164369 isoform X4 [Nothobranchius furzeri]
MASDKEPNKQGRRTQQRSPQVAEAATEAVQNILSVLNQSLGNSRTDNSQGQNSRQPQSMDEEMARSFPGLFRRGTKRNSPCMYRPTKIAKHWSSFNFTVFLLCKNCDTTPSPVQDLQHMQAGLGKRTLSMPKDFTHAEVSSLFQSTYPKMKTISGGWLLYKAAGGNGRRHLSVVPPESEGYTGSTIRSASAGGKTMLYIVPLQEEFDLTPLPHDAQEFGLMPKAECKTCLKIMPLQLLALHVKQCSAPDTVSDSELDSEPEVVEIPCHYEKPKEGTCPLCQVVFPTRDLEIHASVCGDVGSHLDSPASYDSASPVGLQLLQNEEMSCEEDVLRWLAAQVDASKEFCLCVSRTNLIERGLMLWQRQKHSSPQNVLKVEEVEDLSSCTEQIINCGYTGPINKDNKDKIKRAIMLHSAARRTLMLRQLREGLQLYGLMGVMEKNRQLCRDLFVAGNSDEVDSFYIVSHLCPKMSEKGTQRHATEIQILNNFQDFLQELEDGSAEDGLSVPDVMQWLTGQAHRHLLLSERETFKIHVNFDHTCMERMPQHTTCYPVVSACTQTITFPSVHFVNKNDFNEKMETAVKSGAGFHLI